MRNFDLLLMLLPSVARATNGSDHLVKEIKIPDAVPYGLRYEGNINGTTGAGLPFFESFVCVFEAPKEDTFQGYMITSYVITVHGIIEVNGEHHSVEESFSGHFYPVPGSNPAFTLNQPLHLKPVS